MPIDKRILAVREELALVRGSAVPDDVVRGPGRGFNLNDQDKKDPPHEDDIADAVRRYRDMHHGDYVGPGSSFDLVAVALADLKKVGWSVSDEVEPLRTSGQIKLSEIRVGEAYYDEEDEDGTPNTLVVEAQVDPPDLPDEGWSSVGVKYTQAKSRANRLVRLIPSYRASAPPLRKSGKALPSQLVAGEAYLSPRGERVIVAAKFPSQPSSWLWHTVGATSLDEEGPVDIIPSYLDKEPRTSGPGLVKHARPGEAFEYVDKKTNGAYKMLVIADNAPVPKLLPTGWLYRHESAKLAENERITFIPSFLTEKPALRTSGRSLPSKLVAGEAYRSREGDRVIIVPQGETAPADMRAENDKATIGREMWSYLNEGSKGVDYQGEVEIIPSYRTPVGMPVERDKRIIEVHTVEKHGELAVIPAEHVPAGMSRGPSYDIPMGDGGPKLPISAEDVKKLTSYYPSYHGPGSYGYFTTVKLSDLEKAGWQVGAPKVETRVEAVAPTHKHGNSGRTYTFVTGKNPIDSALGWKPTDLAGDGKSLSFDPVAPVMAVHDLMEHFPGDEYDPHNEYMAQGAMLWLRFEGGFFPDSSPTGLAAAVVKPAFGMLFYHIRQQKLETKEWTAGEMDPFKKMKEGTAFALLELITVAQRHAVASTSYQDERNRLTKSLARSIPWITNGYVRASERYAGLDKLKLIRLYKNTVAQIEKFTEGSTLKLTMEYEKYTSRVELTIPVKS